MRNAILETKISQYSLPEASFLHKKMENLEAIFIFIFRYIFKLSFLFKAQYLDAYLTDFTGFWRDLTGRLSNLLFTEIWLRSDSFSVGFSCEISSEIKLFWLL